MSAVIWRNAGPDDAAALAQVGRESFVETFAHLYSAENLAAFLDENHTEAGWRVELGNPAYAVRIGEADGKAVAYAKLGPPSLPYKADGPAIELRQFYVLRPWQGAGLAPELMDWVIAQARTRGATEIQLSVFTENVRAQRFYQRYGFETVGEYAFMVGSQADEDLIMRLKLAP